MNNNPHDPLGKISALCRYTAAIIWAYQGLVPKLLGPHTDEIALIRASGLPVEHAVRIAQLAGISELALAFALLLYGVYEWPHWVAILTLSAFLLMVCVCAPQYLSGAFNPVAMNISLGVLSVVAIAAIRAKVAST